MSSGETGSGKSMLISALEYICGINKKRILGRFNESIISLSLSSLNDKDNKLYSKVYNCKTKKTITEIEGEKIAMKDMTNDLLKVVSIFTSLLL